MPDEILADVECMEIMRDCALVIANFKYRMTVHDAAIRLGMNHTQIRAAIESGQLKALDMSKTGSGSGKNRAYRITYTDLAEYARNYPRAVKHDPLP